MCVPLIYLCPHTTRRWRSWGARSQQERERKCWWGRSGCGGHWRREGQNRRKGKKTRGNWQLPLVHGFVFLRGRAGVWVCSGCKLWGGGVTPRSLCLSATFPSPGTGNVLEVKVWCFFFTRACTHVHTCLRPSTGTHMHTRTHSFSEKKKTGRAGGNRSTLAEFARMDSFKRQGVLTILPYYYTCVLIVLYRCPHDTTHYYVCPHLLYRCPRTRMDSFESQGILTILYISTCVLKLQCRCPHTTIRVSSYYYRALGYMYSSSMRTHI